jgi:hypothetical protein
VSVNIGGNDGIQPLTATEGAGGIHGMLNDVFSTYTPTNHLNVVNVTALFTERVNFKQYTSKKLRWLGIKIYKWYEIRRYTYDMDIYLGKNWTCDYT